MTTPSTQIGAGSESPPQAGSVCRDCGGPMPESPNRIRNVCNPEGEFPYCSRSCAEHAYWQRDLPAFLDEFDREMKQNALAQGRGD